MFEIIVLFMIMVLFVSCFFPPFASLPSLFSRLRFFKSNPKAIVSPEQIQNASETPHFLSYLQSQIEAELFPRPTDSVLQRHYDTLVAVELENRLSIMAE